MPHSALHFRKNLDSCLNPLKQTFKNLGKVLMFSYYHLFEFNGFESLLLYHSISALIDLQASEIWSGHIWRGQPTCMN